jgi:uncharacterized membrane protein YhiD involved in acid resistance
MSTFALPVPVATLAIFLGRATAALVLGGLIGAERQWRSRMAGLRTNALVELGAALFELLALLLASSPTVGIEHGAVDFTRVTAYVVSGVGFLGAGVIIRDSVNVRGINTAATVWCSAAVGALCGNGYVPEAAIGPVAVLAGQLLLRPVAHRIDRQPIDRRARSRPPTALTRSVVPPTKLTSERSSPKPLLPASSASEPRAARTSRSARTESGSPPSSKAPDATTSPWRTR